VKREPHSLLFLSCDLVGSTQFKQSQSERATSSSQTWQKVFLSFYREFPQKVGETAKMFEEENRTAGSSVGATSFQLWKPIGDELVFTVTVKSERDVAAAVRIWLAALNAYEKDSLSDSPLSTKGGAFIATFPGPDSYATIPLNPMMEASSADVAWLNEQALSKKWNRNNYMYDYFGPSIDTGFRIYSACSQRFFSLSIEVAYCLAHCHSSQVQAERGIYESVDLAFIGNKAFKGVWNGREYPLFAVDRHHDEEINAALRVVTDDRLDPAHVKAVAHACLSSNGWPSRLFLPEGNNQLVQATPESVLHPDETTTVIGFETAPSPGASNLKAIAEDAPLK
jgi:hypothetical protein